MTHLTLQQVKDAARAAYDNRQLIAQHPGESLCYRNSKGHVCAIGAALTPEEAEQVQKSGYSFIDSLITYGPITIPASDHADEFRAIQRAHDAWSGIPYNADAEARFLSLLK